MTPRAYVKGPTPTLDSLDREYNAREFTKLAQSSKSLVGFLATRTVNAANDAAAAAAGVPIGGFYHNAGAVRIRLT